MNYYSWRQTSGTAITHERLDIIWGGDTVERVNTLCALHTFVVTNSFNFRFFFFLFSILKKNGEKDEKKKLPRISCRWCLMARKQLTRGFEVYLWRYDVQQSAEFSLWCRCGGGIFLRLQFLSQIYSDNVNTHGPYALLKVTGGFSIEHLLLFRRPRIVEIEEETKETKTITT